MRGVVVRITLNMIATAHIDFDRRYFELQYDEWLHHRSKYKRYEIWLAVALIGSGITMAIFFAEQWLVGGLFACAGVYEFVMAATHKRRWVKARVSTARKDKCVDVTFDGESLTTTSPNGSATWRYAGFIGFVTASHGFFLIPDTGISIYVPRATIDPTDSYSALVDLLASATGTRGEHRG